MSYQKVPQDPYPPPGYGSVYPPPQPPPPPGYPSAPPVNPYEGYPPPPQYHHHHHQPPPPYAYQGYFNPGCGHPPPPPPPHCDHYHEGNDSFTDFLRGCLLVYQMKLNLWCFSLFSSRSPATKRYLGTEKNTLIDILLEINHGITDEPFEIYNVHTKSGASFRGPAKVRYKYIFSTFCLSSQLPSICSPSLMTSTLSIGIFFARVLHASSVNKQDDIQRDRIVSYFPTSARRAMFPKGLSLISSFLSFLHPLSTRPETDNLFRPLHDRTMAPKPSSRGCQVVASGTTGLRVHNLNRIKLGQFFATVASAALVIR
ncbi:hypothetical protein Leryth_009287 [Lithospermum erythrorhizon]|nr:hypothetical protein Leryth_009287 [Lithospermum erythrorhizon]